MDEEECLHRFGLRPGAADLGDIRTLLSEHTERERRAQGEGDTELMKLCCVQLFNGGDLDDALLVWSAKEARYDGSTAAPETRGCYSCSASLASRNACPLPRVLATTAS